MIKLNMSLAATCLTSLLALPAAAQDTGLYGNIATGIMNNKEVVDGGSVKYSTTNVVGRVGYSFNQNLALEGEAGFTIAKDTVAIEAHIPQVSR